jgi:hypothetical protein
LAQVPDWQSVSVTQAAQAVQHSAAPGAYARWEPQARLLARVLTGELPAGMTCTYSAAAASLPGEQLSQAISTELGTPATDAPVSAARGWTVAAWLIAHGHEYDVNAVTFSGSRWTRQTNAWFADPTADDTVRIS